ncbi:hypothetical protein HPB52_009584 [Rhipicephalus sanguineus]|uniref:Cullin family profile domain-containing protein n=1 Tax=Rhipicephalus sanguineus TaxID=34632 RepID=A0A9D4Q5T8_RHISA|nr:hypothetical protein HPB52_009584 [Rhipicephalus sanguineus]
MRHFKKAVSSCRAELHGVDLNMPVLTTGSWPLAAVTQQSKIPQRTSHPRLKWRAHRPASFIRELTYVIQVTTYQMCVLMLFNHHDAISYQDMASETNTPASNEIEKDHTFAVNDVFTSSLQKVKIESTPSKKNAAPKQTEAPVNLDDDRKYELEAAIREGLPSRLRGSHARKTLSLENLVEATKLLQTRYTPSPAAFRDRVDALIQKEYLERAGEDPESDSAHLSSAPAEINLSAAISRRVLKLCLSTGNLRNNGNKEKRGRARKHAMAAPTRAG